MEKRRALQLLVEPAYLVDVLKHSTKLSTNDGISTTKCGCTETSQCQVKSRSFLTFSHYRVLLKLAAMRRRVQSKNATKNAKSHRPNGSH